MRETLKLETSEGYQDADIYHESYKVNAAKYANKLFSKFDDSLKKITFLYSLKTASVTHAL